jgi:hypothetical protein
VKTALALLVLLGILAAAALLPARPYLDFQVIYHADLGLLRGIPLYDHAGQVEMIAGLAKIPADHVFVLPFPYPPWYALITVWLALLPIETAARVWFGINLLVAVVALGLLTRGMRARWRTAAAIAGLLWLPMLGTLFVGQYGLPVLLGAVLLIDGLERENEVLVGVAAALLTFKPHLGAVVLLLVLLHLLFRRDAFARKALAAIAVAAVVLILVGYVASPNWPVEYLRSLTGFREFGEVSKCEQCVSLSTLLARASGGGLSQAAWISAGMAVLLAGWLASRWRQVAAAPGSLITGAVLVTMLASPYLLNYDYLMLVVPFVEIVRGTTGLRTWTAISVAYGLPLAALALLGTAGNASLVISACLLFAVFALRRRQADDLRAVNVT